MSSLRPTGSASPIRRATSTLDVDLEQEFEGIEYADRCYVVEYSSVSSVPRDKVRMPKIAKAARGVQGNPDITGVLCYFAATNSFYQRLEGPEKAILDVLMEIVVDPHHIEVFIERAATGRRIFSDMVVATVVDVNDSNPDVLFQNLQPLSRLGPVTVTSAKTQPEDHALEEATSPLDLSDPNPEVPERRVLPPPPCATPVRTRRKPQPRRDYRYRLPTMWLHPNIPLRPQSPWYAVLKCRHIMRNGDGFMRVVGPPTSKHIGRKIYVPPGYLNHVGDHYVGHLKLKDKFDGSFPLEKCELISSLASLHYAWDNRVPIRDRTRAPVWVTGGPIRYCQRNERNQRGQQKTEQGGPLSVSVVQAVEV